MYECLNERMNEQLNSLNVFCTFDISLHWIFYEYSSKQVNNWGGVNGQDLAPLIPAIFLYCLLTCARHTHICKAIPVSSSRSTDAHVVHSVCRTAFQVFVNSSVSLGVSNVKSVNRFLIGSSLTLHVVLHEQKRKTERRRDVALIVRVTRLAALYNSSPTIVPYIFEVVNVTTYI